MEYIVKVVVITPDSFNEFDTESTESVSVNGGYLKIVEVQGGMVIRTKVYAPGQWCTVDSQLIEVVGDDDDEEVGFLGI